MNKFKIAKVIVVRSILTYPELTDAFHTAESIKTQKLLLATCLYCFFTEELPSEKFCN